ncbi:MAG: nitroreductase family protein [Planctomycetota bacterium]
MSAEQAGIAGEAGSVNASAAGVIPSIRQRWSPYRFREQAITDGALRRCLEAARWAASSFNDQPWYWIVARRQESEAFDAMIACLMEANRAWASRAGALILTVTRDQFAYNGKPNRVALHDLGAAAAQLALQAVAEGLQVHQMAGIQLAQITAQYGLPEGHQPQTAIAIGYPATDAPTDALDVQLHQRQSGPRERRALSEQVFAGRFGHAAEWL